MSVEQDVTCIRNVVCEQCSQFLEKVFIPSKRDRVFTVPPGKFLVQQPGQYRKFEDVVASASQGCWMCDNAVAAARASWHDGFQPKSIYISYQDVVVDQITVRGSHSSRYDTLCRFKLDEISERDLPADENTCHDNEYWGEKTFELAGRWLRQCEYEHEDCNVSFLDAPSGFQPSRLLDLRNVSEGILKLVTPQDFPVAQKYAALSHCWGGKRVGLLRTTNVVEFTKSFSLHDLPRTFKDAIQVCRDLSIQFLWLDSLCIIQDSKEDWAKEAPLMCETFSNAILTIAAVAAHADEEGFLQKENPHLLSPLIVNHVTTDDCRKYRRIQPEENFETFVNGARLNSRGWVFQERALSRRILSFAEDQVYWECASTVEAAHKLRYRNMEFANVVKPPSRDLMNWTSVSLQTKHMGGADHVMTDPGKTDLLIQPHRLNQRQQTVNTVLHLKIWETLVEQYSEGNLTYTSDKFMAIAGIARRVCELAEWKPEDYIAGHWREGLPASLLWCMDEPYNGPANNAPSWSWASVNQGIKIIANASPFTNRMQWRKLFREDRYRTIVAEVLSATALSPTGTFGYSEQGCISMSCDLCEVRLRWDIWAGNRVSIRVGKKWFSLLKHGRISVCMDRKRPFHGIFGRTVFFAPILLCEYFPQNKEVEAGSHRISYHGLMLEPTGVTEGQFRRVGVMSIDTDRIGDERNDYTNVALVREAFRCKSIRKAFYRTYDEKEKYVIDLV